MTSGKTISGAAPDPSDEPSAQPDPKTNGIEQTYKAHFRPLVVSLVRVFGQGPPEPEDLAQEAFVRFAQLAEHEKIEFPRALLFRIALNLGFNASKRISTARRHIEEALQAAGAPLVEELTPEDVYTSKRRVAAMLEAMERLSPKQREIVILSRIHGKTYAEITHQTGWSQADISRQLNAALATIQTTLRHNEGQ